MKKLTSILSVVFVFKVFVFPATASDSKQPNVILIISDDHAWTDYSFAGHTHARTPNIDRLAAEGLTFTRGYVTTAIC